MRRRMYLSCVKYDAMDGWRSQMQSNASSFIASLKSQGVDTCSVFSHEHVLFVYTEGPDEVWSLQWPQGAQDCLECWPALHGGGVTIELVDIFHDNRPLPDKPWRTSEPQSRMAALARLRSDMVSSYVYYHYQLQEERPGSFNKTYMIGSHDTYLFSYCEQPSGKSDAPPGRLNTNQTPANWHEVMEPHFEPWEDGEHAVLWKSMKLEFCYSSFKPEKGATIL